MPLQGSLDNRYEVRRSLGRGGMAEVYLARDRVLDRDVALKVLSRCYAEDEDFVRRFRREARSAASLAHPNVVSIHDLGEVEGEGGEPPTYYIAMEYVDGISLRDLLEREVRLSCETAVLIASQVAEGLAAAHERGIVHRDIKPHNILLSGSFLDEERPAGRGAVKVADFGIARAAASSNATRTEGILGTAHYIAPEQAMGCEATPRSDLYSLGVVIYEMLTGRRPYDADSPFGVAMQHVTGDLRPPKRTLPDLPEELNATVVRLLGKDPEERHADAGELLDELYAFAQHPEPDREAVAGRGRQRRAGLLVPICALILLTASLWGVQQGFGLSSLTGISPGDVRSGVEEIFGGLDGSDAPQGDFAPPQAPESGATSRERDGDEAQRKDGASSGEDPSGEDPSSDEPSGEGGSSGKDPEQSAPEESGSPGNESSENSSSDRPSAEESTGGEPSASEPPESASEVPRKEGGETAPAPAPGGQSGGGAAGGGGGERLIYVPDLAGQDVETARSTLLSTGFEVAGVVEQPGSSAEGTVLYTDPAAGSALEPGTGVTLVVSSGPPETTAPDGGGNDPGSGGAGSGVPGGSTGGGSGGGSSGGADEEDTVSVPDVTGRQSEQAVMILESAGLRAEVRGAFGGEASGTVASTDPPAGTTVEEGTVVTLTVTDGPKPASAPSEESPSGDQYRHDQYADSASDSAPDAP